MDPECLKKASNLGNAIAATSKSKPAYVTTGRHLVGRKPQLNEEETYSIMTDDERKALEVIAEFAEAHAGIFEGFEPIKKERPEPEPRPEPAEPRPAPVPEISPISHLNPKERRAAYKEAKRVGLCIQQIIGEQREPGLVQTASKICLCSGESWRLFK